MPQKGVIGLGCAALDLPGIVQTFPPPGEKASTRHLSPCLGGLASKALETAATLGSLASYAGIFGYDKMVSQTVTDLMRAGGIDLQHVVYQEGARPLVSFNVTDKTGERICYFDDT